MDILLCLTYKTCFRILTLFRFEDIFFWMIDMGRKTLHQVQVAFAANGPHFKRIRLASIKVLRFFIIANPVVAFANPDVNASFLFPKSIEYRAFWKIIFSPPIDLIPSLLFRTTNLF